MISTRLQLIVVVVGLSAFGCAPDVDQTKSFRAMQLRSAVGNAEYSENLSKKYLEVAQQREKESEDLLAEMRRQRMNVDKCQANCATTATARGASVVPIKTIKKEHE